MLKNKVGFDFFLELVLTIKIIIYSAEKLKVNSLRT